MISDKDVANEDKVPQDAVKKEIDSKKTGVPGSPPDPELMGKFIHGDSTHEIKHAAKEIIASDSEIDEDKLNEAGIQFQKEKKEDKEKQAENDAEFEQPGQ